MQYKVEHFYPTRGDIDDALERRLNNRFQNGGWKLHSISKEDNGYLIVYFREAV